MGHLSGTATSCDIHPRPWRGPWKVLALRWTGVVRFKGKNIRLRAKAAVRTRADVDRINMLRREYDAPYRRLLRDRVK